MLKQCFFIPVLVCLLLSCNSQKTNALDKDGSFSGLVVRAWKGYGSGGEAREISQIKGMPVFYAVGGAGSDDQTVIVAEKPDVTLLEGHYYELSTEVKTEGVTNFLYLFAAIRAGKTNDIFERLDRADSWRRMTLLIKPTATAAPKYFAVRLYGPGKVWATAFKLREVTESEYETLAAEKKRETFLSVEKVMRKSPPTLPLADESSPRAYRLWGNSEEQYAPPPFGWRRVPGERSNNSYDGVPGFSSSRYLVYARNLETPVYLESIPRQHELIERLAVSATPGEYEPASFAVYANEYLEGIRVRVSDLKTAGGSTIQKANIDVRTVNFSRKISDNDNKTYFLMPLTLGKGPDFIEAGTSRRYWLTLYVPKSTLPGVYRGTVEFTPGNAPQRAIAIELTVLPFELLDPPAVRFMWSPKVKSPQLEYAMFADMAEHGLTTMMVSGDVKNRDNLVDREDIDNIVQGIERGLALHKRIGFRDHPIGGVSNNQIIYYWDKTLNWTRYWPRSKDLDEQFLSTYRQVFIDNEASKKWPQIYQYVVDEPGGMYPKNIGPTAHYLQLLKKEFPQLKTFVTIGGGMKQGYDEVGKLSPYLDVTTTNYVTKDMIDRLAKIRSELWVYNGSSLSEEPAKERFFFGWYLWKIGAKGIGQWTYAWTGNPYAAAFRDGRQDYALETPGGFIPTVGLELIREGVDDYKYIHTLSRLIRYGMKSGNKDLADKAVRADQRLAALVGKVNTNYLRGKDVPESNVVVLSAGELGSMRQEVVHSITELINAAAMSWPVLHELLMKEAYVKPSSSDSLRDQ